MRNLPLPPVTASEAFYLCAADTADEALKIRLLGAANAITLAGEVYLKAGEARTWYQLPDSIQVLSATDDDLNNLYPRTMSASTKAGRPIYDLIFSSSPQGICPVCGQGRVTTLDHYLPRSRYAHYSVLPANLVPCCRDCNFAKREKYPSVETEQTFHPYFDNVEQDRWLYCTLEISGGVSLSYFVQAPESWSPVAVARAERHLSVFKLRAAFATYAASELSTLKGRLQILFDRGGARLVREDLEIEAEGSRQASLNSWKTAAYEALAASDEFCDGGFHDIAL